MKYPGFDTYNKLYGRYLTKGIEPFFSEVDLNGKRVLDLCAGNGRLSQYAIDNGAAGVVMVDLAPQMLNPDFNGRGCAVQIEGNIEDFFRNFHSGCPYEITPSIQGMKECYIGGFPDEDTFDVVTCRQGINYWFENVSGEQISGVIKKHGKFIFNTFGNKPSETPTMREYFHKGIAYKEISYLVGNMVHHVQTAAGFPPHMTAFHWISPEEFRQKLSPYFIIREVVNGPSSMWYCTKI